ncbi:unnamed protein product [Enterobius vermicularis]|uniref:SCP domain-containing protein n=1 Tax=Enterobius vermicularis TaxID=51028 RepID=A0A158QB24_ENTVE|nr:unnamed protein product [Enterobius vermicularis]
MLDSGNYDIDDDDDDYDDNTVTSVMMMADDRRPRRQLTPLTRLYLKDSERNWKEEEDEEKKMKDKKGERKIRFSKTAAVAVATASVVSNSYNSASFTCQGVHIDKYVAAVWDAWMISIANTAYLAGNQQQHCGQNAGKNNAHAIPYSCGG